LGLYKPEFVIGLVFSQWATKELNEFVEKHPDLFFKFPEGLNGDVTYVMGWDGSKEGWDASNEADELRNKFIQLLKDVPYSKIYHIEHPEEETPILRFMRGFW